MPPQSWLQELRVGEHHDGEEDGDSPSGSFHKRKRNGGELIHQRAHRQQHCNSDSAHTDHLRKVDAPPHQGQGHEHARGHQTENRVQRRLAQLPVMGQHDAEEETV